MKRLKFDLKEAIDSYTARVGLKMTYQELAQQTGISVDTLKSIANRDNYNPTLDIIEKICLALNTSPLEHLRWE